MVTEMQILEECFHLELQGLSARWKTFNLGFWTGNPEIAGEIQILRQVFQTETYILIVISSPAHLVDSKHHDGRFVTSHFVQ